MNIVLKEFLFIFLFLSTNFIFSNTKNYNETLDSFAEKVFSQAYEDIYIIDQYNETKSKIEKSEMSENEKKFFLIKLNYYMSKNYVFFQSTEKMLSHYKDTKTGKFKNLKKFFSDAKKAEKYAEKALEEAISLSKSGYISDDLILIQSALYGDLCLLKDFNFLLANGLKPAKLCNEVLKNSPKNINALLMKATEKIYSPKIFGGDPKKGIDFLDKVVASDDFEKSSRVLKNDVYTGYAMAYGLSGNFDMAENYVKKALEIFPKCMYTLGIKELIELKQF